MGNTNDKPQSALPSSTTGVGGPVPTVSPIKALDEASRTQERFDGFDPTGLERAAKAAKELQESKYAEEAIRLAKEQESTRQREALAKIEENKAKQRAFEAEQIRIQEEERRKTIETDKNAKQQHAYYQDQLARKRGQDQLNAERQAREENLKRQEESQMRIEALKRQTAEYEANIKKETDKARIEAEAKGKTQQERENWDLRMQRSRMEAQEFRVTVLQGVKEAGAILGQGLRDYITDYEKLANTALVFTGIAFGIYTAKNTTAVASRIIEARLSKPPLIRETSRTPLLQLFTKPFSTLSNVFRGKTNPLEGMVFETTLRYRLNNLAISTANTRKNNSPYRHMLLHGPPGTGKTMFAKNLAKSSGMDYAIMTGGDVAPLGRDAVTEIHKIFDWSNRSRRGLILFVDEADAFLRKRTNATLSEDLRNALNAFLYRTGDSSKKFMVVFATNQPDQLDWAINDRIDEMINFKLPGEQERYDMLKLYFDYFVSNSHKQTGFSLFGAPKQIRVEGVDDSTFNELARITNGFSGREISKLAIAWQSAARGTVDCVIDGPTMIKIAQDRADQHKQKQIWETDKE